MVSLEGDRHILTSQTTQQNKHADIHQKNEIISGFYESEAALSSSQVTTANPLIHTVSRTAFRYSNLELCIE